MISLLHFIQVYDLIRTTLISKDFTFVREHPWNHLLIKCKSYKQFFNLMRYYNFKKFYIKQKDEDDDLNKQCLKYDKLDVDTKKIFQLNYLRIRTQPVLIYRYFRNLLKSNFPHKTESLNLVSGLIFNRYSITEIESTKCSYLKNNPSAVKQLVNDEVGPQ